MSRSCSELTVSCLMEPYGQIRELSQRWSRRHMFKHNQQLNHHTCKVSMHPLSTSWESQSSLACQRSKPRHRHRLSNASFCTCREEPHIPIVSRLVMSYNRYYSCTAPTHQSSQICARQLGHLLYRSIPWLALRMCKEANCCRLTLLFLCKSKGCTIEQ